MSHAAVGFPLVVLAATLATACGAAPAPSLARMPTVAPTPTLAPMPTVAPTATPRPTVLAFPSSGPLELAAGTYDSSPPFDVAFTFVVPRDGWNSAHVHQDFFDVMRLDGPDPVAPTAWVAWALPQKVIGADTRAATDLTAAEAAALIASKPGVTATAAAPFTFLGRDGVQLDLSAELPNTYIFGSGDGNFGLDPAYPMRLGIVANDEGLLFVLCLIQSGSGGEGCGEESRQIVDSVKR